MQEVSLAETDHQAASIRHRLGELLDERMSRRTESVELFREALETVPGHKRTVTSLEKMLSGFGEGLTEDPGTRRRICEILEEHYRQEGNWLKLVDVFTAQYEDAEDVERKAELLRQIAAIQEQRLHDLQGAFSSLAKGFALRYGDQALREDLERLAGTLNWWERVVNTYLEGIEDVDDPLLAADMLRRLGSIFDEKLGHNENAIEIYRRLLLIEDDAPDALDALERLYTRTGRHEELVGVLHRKALVSPEVLERKELLYRICEIWEDVVGDRDRAIETYRAVREQDPDDLSAVEALERLYRTTGDWVSLVDLYREMAELALEEEERLRCWFEVARLSQEELDDPDGAVDAYRAVLDVEVGNRKALRALEALYEQEGQWASLLDALEMALSATEDADEQIRVRMRMGSLLRHKLDDVPRAVETFRTVLDRQPDHSGALGALEELLADAEWRQAAARVLEPVYDARQDWPRLVGVLAIRATGADDPEARVELLRRQAMIQERHLDAAALACTTLGEALRLQPYSTELADELERLARLEGDLGELVDVLGDVRGAVEDPETFRALSLRMARVLDGDLGRPAAAIDCFEQVRESDPYHLGALDALDRLYRETERWVELGAVIEARMALADPEDATALRFRLGELKERAFEDAAGALECYRQILWDEPGHTGAREALARIGESIELREAVVEVLEPIYRSEGEWRPLLALLDRKLDLVEEALDRSELLRDTAELAEVQLGDPDEAFDRYVRALNAYPAARDARLAAERLAADLSRWDELVGALDRAAERTEDMDLARELRMAAGIAYRDRVGAPERAEASFRAVLEILADDPAALDALEDLYERTGDDRSRVDVLLRKADAAMDGEERRRVYRLAADIASVGLEDYDLATSALRKVLELDESDTAALEALEALAEKTHDAQTLAEVLELRVGRTGDGEELLALHRRLGGLYGALDRSDAACEHYRAVLDFEQDDRQALYTLCNLYEQSGKWLQLQEILLRRVEIEEQDAAKVALLKRAAHLMEDEFEDSAGAAEQLRRAFEIDRTDRDALTAMARLYRRLERWDELVVALEAHADLAVDPAEKVPLLVAISEVAQEHLGDAELTKESLNRVLDAEPDNLDALDVLRRTYEHEEDWRECFRVLDRQIALLRDADASRRGALLHRRGEILADHLGRAEEAVLAFDMAAEADPSRMDTVDRLVMLAEAAEDWAALAEHLRARARIVADPAQKAAALKAVARIATAQLQDPAAAVEALERARYLTPEDPEVARPLVDAYLEAGHWEQARPLLDTLIEALRERRKLKELHVYLHLRGKVALQAGDGEAARKDFEAAHDLDATYVPNLFSLGKWYFEHEQWEQALKIFQTMLLHQADIKADKDKAEIFWHLGKVRLALGDPRRAKDMFNRAVMLVPGHERSKRALAEL